MLAAHVDEFGRYPMNKGLDAFGEAVAQLAQPPLRAAAPGRSRGRSAGAQRHARGPVPGRARRQALCAAARRPAGRADAQSVLCGLFGRRGRRRLRAGLSAGDRAPPAFCPTSMRSATTCLARTVAFYLASPSNPQGAVADGAYLRGLPALARRHGFLIFSDECYCEIYSDQPPPGMLEAAGAGLRQRRGVPLAVEALEPARSARRLRRRRPALPRRLSRAAQRRRAAGAGAGAARRHRGLRRRDPRRGEPRASIAPKFDLADQIVGDRYGYRRPAGGFFLWLDVSAQGGSEAATLALWREAGVRVVPGRYLAREQADGSNPGADYIRVAMVQNKEITAEALHRLVAVLGHDLRKVAL